MSDRVDLCGALSVVLGDRAVERSFPGRQGRLVFAYLAAHHPEPVPREELLAVLWPEGSPPRSARDALNVVLSKVKRALSEGGAGIAGRDRVGLEMPPGTVIDLHECERLIDEAEAAGDPATAHARADAALAIAERGLLPGLEGNWLEELRLELEERRMRALEVVAASGLQLGGAALATAERAARMLIVAAPYRESGHRLLMELLAGRGDVAEALRVYDHLRVLLREELGIAPAPAVKALHQRLLELGEQPAAPPPQAGESTGPSPDRPRSPGDAADGPLLPAVPFPPVLRRLAPAKFVGRANSLQALEDAWAAEDQRLLAVAGEPGVGKTALAARFAAARHAQGALVLYGRCDEDGLAPYGPVAEALAPLVETADSRPELRDLVGDLGPTAPDAERLRLFNAVERLLGRAVAVRPVVFVLDDVHWADRPTLALLRHLARAPLGAHRLLILGTYRDDEASTGHPLRSLLSDLRRESVADTIALTGLDEAETADLVEALAPTTVRPDAVRRLHEGTDGNPLFIRELVRAAGEDVDGAFERVPPGLSEAIRRRLVPLPAPVTRALQVAAVAGREFDLQLLEQVPELAGEDVLEMLEAASEARIVAEVPDRLGRFLFAHALVRDALYQDLTATRRARLHLQLADALEAGEVRPGEVAYHVVQARAVVPRKRLVAVLERAGEHARRQLAYEEAAAHFEAALDAAEDELERCHLALAAGEAHQRTGEQSEAREFFELAAGLARGRDPGLLVRAALGVRGPYIDSGVVDDEAVALLEEAIAACGDGWLDLRTIAQARLAQALYWAGDPQRIDELSAEAVAFARMLDEPAVLAPALEARHEVLRVPWALDERRHLVDDFLRRAKEIGDDELAAQAHQLMAVDALEAGDVETWEAEVGAVRRLAGELRQPMLERYVHMWEHLRAHLDGRLADAERSAHEALAAAVRAGAQDGPQAFGAQMFNVLSLRGGVESMRPVVEAIVFQYPTLSVWRAGLARIHAELGDEDQAREILDELASKRFAAVAPDFFWLLALMLAGDAATLVREERHAAVLREMLAPYAAHHVLARGATCYGPVARTLGGLAGVLGDAKEAERRFEEAVVLSRRLRSPMLEAQVRVEQAAVRIASDTDVEGALVLLRDASQTCWLLGAKRLAARAESLVPEAVRTTP